MTAGLQRYLSTGVLAIWGTTFLYVFYSGRVINALHPTFRPLLLAAGVVLLLLAAGVMFLPQALGAEQKPAWARLLSAVILTLPLLIVVAMSPDKFDATFVQNRGYVEDVSKLNYKPFVEPALPTEDGTPGPTGTPDPSEAFVPKTPAGNLKLQTIDLVYAAEEPSMRQDIENKKIEMIGQFMPARANNASGNRFDLVRMFMNCCAADARPVAALVQGAKPDGTQEMGWVKVVGKATFPFEGGRQIPVVEAESVTPCDPPEETFIQ